MNEDKVDEQFAFALLADTLIESLDLRPDCRDALVAELFRERELVVAWLSKLGRTDSRDEVAAAGRPIA